MKESMMYCHKRNATHNKDLVGDFWYDDCQVSPQTTRLYDSKAPISEVLVKEMSDGDKSSYWAWWDNDSDRFTMLYYHRDLLSICFPYGIEAEVDRGRGKDYNVSVDEMRVINPRDL